MKQMHELKFWKMNGAGNDFVLIDNRAAAYDCPWEGVAPRICDRHRGIGADGLLVLTQRPGADFRMEYFNADGSSGGMCGNGGRCAAAHVMAGTGKQEVSFYALDYLYRARKISDHSISLSMKDPRDIRLHQSLELNGRTLCYHYADTGAPHVVLYADEIGAEGLEGIDILTLGHSVRHHGAFLPGGTNVNVIQTSGRDTIAMRTYERGVEAETLACGTGSVASAVITSILKGWESPVTVLTRSGESLSVHFEGSGDLRTGVRLQGPALTVFEGLYICAHEN